MSDKHLESLVVVECPLYVSILWSLLPLVFFMPLTLTYRVFRLVPGFQVLVNVVTVI